MIQRLRTLLSVSLLLLSAGSYSQDKALKLFLSDSSMIHSAVSVCVKDAGNGETITCYNPHQSLIPASVMKLITSGVALELLGPEHVFRTFLGYTGTLNKRTGRLSGNIVIGGGGDPALGSKYFSDHYQDFIGGWVSEIKMTGIRKVDGCVITDDSYYDFSPVPAKWLWEDLGNYYGAGVYGLSVFDNTAEIHLQTSADSFPARITGINPMEYRYEFENRLRSSGTRDEGNVFAAPYSEHGWLTGSVPVNQEDFILKSPFQTLRCWLQDY